ncbi:PorT family protein [Carboxylicivirga mesophila]|uniref:PorT family protein n=1 Tax=Carboxylicivirga mesophila TaxID=1166478 RepID=A0ABS5K7K2_9BACT|nr:porin family protein [Carboxylicivirga mesophila]MBS2210348.1 PorT family protein [Carboxylicivirga mesophila]
MKKILMIVAVMAFVASASAQTTFGVKAGVNFASLSDDFSDMDSKMGLAVGAFAKFELSEKFAFQPELLFSAQGAKLEEGGAEMKIKANYLNLPLMGKYYLAEGFSLQAGPQIGFLMSANAELTGAGEENFDEDIKDEMKGIDFGLNFGAGYELENGLGFDARYNLGLSNIIDSDEETAKNGVFQITVSYAF